MTFVRRAAIVLFYLAIAVLTLNALIANFTTAMPGLVKMQASNDIQPSEFLCHLHFADGMRKDNVGSIGPGPQQLRR